MVQKRGNYISTQDHAKIQFDFLYSEMWQSLFLEQEKFYLENPQSVVL